MPVRENRSPAERRFGVTRAEGSFGAGVLNEMCRDDRVCEMPVGAAYQ